MIPRLPYPTVYLVGKGPSLLNLRADHFTDKGAVIVLNEALHHVLALGISNPVYSMQKDGCEDVRIRDAGKCDACSGEACGNMVPVPDEVPVILSRHESARCLRDHPTRIFFDAAEMFGDFTTPSAPCAARIARLMGAKRVVLMCFDSLVGDHRTAELRGVVNYGPDEYARASARLIEELGELEYSVVIPTDGGDNDL